MRDLLFKNLTSREKKRKIIASSEIMDKQGIHSVVRRHFIYTMKEIPQEKARKPAPVLYILKEHNQKEQKERFFCKIKGHIVAANKGKLYEISYLHSLQIKLVNIPSLFSEK